MIEAFLAFVVIFVGACAVASCTSANSGDRTMQVPASQPDHVADTRKMVASQDQANVMTKADVEVVAKSDIEAIVDARLVDYKKTVNYNLGGSTFAALLAAGCYLYSKHQAKKHGYDLGRERRLAGIEFEKAVADAADGSLVAYDPMQELEKKP